MVGLAVGNIPAAALTADATDAAQVERMVSGVLSRWGRLDVLVNSVGFRGHMVQVQEITEDEWDVASTPT